MSNLFEGTLVRLAARRPDDIETFARWSNDAIYRRLIDTDMARPLAPEDVAAGPDAGESSSHSVSFRLRTLADDTLIGFVALFNIEWNNGACMTAIGIGEPEYRGKGYGSDALRLILNYAFNELNLYRVGLDVISYNTAAIRAYERAGFQHEGAMRGAVLRDGVRSDRMIMGILRDEWRARHTSA
ncbi:MAG TPA: GNAT family protein [Roseiflexaceae bacterium]|jgi:RimJ/RimL family protein N-acetyltransferase|nr:GNAT family protein [Roseiflexaceae bacterium]